MKRNQSIAIIVSFSFGLLAISFTSCSEKVPTFKFGQSGHTTFEMRNLSNQFVYRGSEQLSRVDKRSSARYDLKTESDGYKLVAFKLSDEIRVDGVVSDSPVARASDSIPITFELDKNGMAIKVTGFDQVIARLDSVLGQGLTRLPNSKEIFAEAAAGEVEKWNSKIAPFLGKKAVVGNKFYYERTLTESFGKAHCYFYAIVKRAYEANDHQVAELFVIGSNSITRLAFECEEPADSLKIAFNLTDQVVDSLSAMPVKVIKKSKRIVGIDNLLTYYDESTNTVSNREANAAGDTVVVRNITKSVNTMYIDGAEAVGAAETQSDRDIK